MDVGARLEGLIIGQASAAHGDVARFERSLAWRLRGWFLALPCGVGRATRRLASPY
jgi:hypothetical protein